MKNGFYRLESVSEGRPISWGSLSITDSPDLLVSVVCMSGLSINSLILRMDQELSLGSCLSRKISCLNALSAGQSVTE